MKLTHYEAQVIKAIDKYVTKYLRKTQGRALRNSILRNVLLLEATPRRGDVGRKQVNDFLPWLNSLVPPLKPTYLSGPITGVVSRAIYAKSAKVDLEQACQAVLKMMQPDAPMIEMQCMMPPPRLMRRSPMTPLEKRASMAQAKVCQWERKLKVAQNKLKKYRRKAKYYARKELQQ